MKFYEFLTESGIQHLEHPADLIFDGKEHTKRALKTLRSIASGTGETSRKLDDKFSFQTIVHGDGKVGVKYKGVGARYNYTHADIDHQHADKPHVKKALNSLLKHMYKVLPHREGEYQGGLMSVYGDREEKNGIISHTPNTIKYSTKADSEEGNKLRNSKISIALHTEITGGKHKPFDISELNPHPDVHVHSHIPTNQSINIKDFKKISDHLSAAELLAKNHPESHLKNHEKTLRMYVNSTVDKNIRPTGEGYRSWLADRGSKEIDSMKSQLGKERKRSEYTEKLHGIEQNIDKFEHTFNLHHHIQQATNHIARSLDRHGHGEFETSIQNKKSGGEGYVMNNMKIVDRQGFSKANRARTAILKGKK